MVKRLFSLMLGLLVILMASVLGLAQAVGEGATLLQESAPPQVALFDWQNIISIVLLVVSTVFGVVWSKARGVLNALHDGLADNNLSKEDIQKIIKAWKG